MPQRRQVQQGLRAAGFDPGGADGLSARGHAPRFEGAVVVRPPADGVLDAATAVVLRSAGGSGPAVAAVPSAPPAGTAGKAIHGGVRVTLGGTPLDEWCWTLATLDHWPPTGGGDEHAARLPSRREFASAAEGGSAGRVSATSRDGCSVFLPPTFLYMRGERWMRTDRPK